MNMKRNQKYQHKWVTVVNPTNRQLLLQACDNCGVVKSENTVIAECPKPQGQHLISGANTTGLKMVG
ncbi:MAG: hypothetical protein HKN85_07995 [Gammaproteobacteria bacterium]|nr:hypothetical protein [Gammaproteobacteria bacterium]